MIFYKNKYFLLYIQLPLHLTPKTGYIGNVVQGHDTQTLK